MSGALTRGAIPAIAKGDQIQNPVLQAVNVRRLDGGSGLPRFRLVMSDGVHFVSSFMLATQLNVLVEQKEIDVNCVCKIKKYIVNTLKDGRRVVVIMDLEVLKCASDVGGKIGEPVLYVEGAAQTTSPTSNPPARPFKQQSSCDSEAPMNRGPPKDFGKQKAFSDPPNTPGGTQSKVVPIASLNPYQSKWTVRARITNKSQIRTWSNSRGEGKLFSMEIVDESGEIRVTGFNEQVDKYYSVIEVNKVYYISKGTLKIANKQYTNVKNDYEMTLSNDTSIVPCDDAGNVPMVQFDFVPIEELVNKEKDSVVDVIGICKSYDEVTKITTKANKEVSKRAVHLMDVSGKVITTTLWGEEAEKFDGSGQPVLAIKGARLSDFGGRSLSVLFSSTLMVNPDVPEAFKLRGWFDSEGHTLEGSSMSEMKGAGGGITNWKTLSEVKTENLGHGDKADYFTCVATIVYLRKENCMYQACPTQDCNKKVVDQQNGLFRCEKCDKEFPNFKYRMILSANIADFGDNQWVTCFQESAEAMLGKSGDYLGELRESNEQAFDEVFQNANFRTYTFRNRVKLETYNDESRIKASVLDVKPVDHKEYSKRLLVNIRKHASQ
ncbi:replication protein A 70 kDa DNA-binding subunit [Polyodon spathula]|uniref:replication protein A 70 kDa DNA-binding subunit n=1 Tax=Polyodon spathula TaxID=7913 RepID=UPI001B7E78E7|nr:replication protein A 70 kDa DNA-binding subunit [Polyodon spathula]